MPTPIPLDTLLSEEDLIEIPLEEDGMRIASVAITGTFSTLQIYSERVSWIAYKVLPGGQHVPYATTHSGERGFFDTDNTRDDEVWLIHIGCVLPGAWVEVANF